jgi:hypothetical protein
MLGAGQIDTIDGMTCVNPYQFDVYLDAPKGRFFPAKDGNGKRVRPIRCDR